MINQEFRFSLAKMYRREQINSLQYLYLIGGPLSNSILHGEFLYILKKSSTLFRFPWTQRELLLTAPK